jgi:exosome complex component RRP43
MDAHVFRLASPDQFISKFISNGIRADGRQDLHSCRQFSVLSFIVPDAAGSAVVRIGHTSVVAGVILNTTLPRPDSKSLGFFQVSLQSEKLSRRESSAIAQKIEDIIRPCIDLNQLCLQAGKTVWHVNVALVSISEDGSLLDACVSAATAALNTTTLPSLDAELRAGGDTYPSAPLTLTQPLPVTLSFCKIPGAQWLPDCTEEEENVSLARITMITGGGVVTSEGPCSSEELATCIIPEFNRLMAIRLEYLGF